MIFHEMQLEELPSMLYQRRAQMPRTAALYVAVSDEGEILYVGQTGNLWERMKTHNRSLRGGDRVYWKEIASKAERIEAEQQTIAALRPAWNGDLFSDKDRW